MSQARVYSKEEYHIAWRQKEELSLTYVCTSTVLVFQQELTILRRENQANLAHDIKIDPSVRAVNLDRLSILNKMQCPGYIDDGWDAVFSRYNGAV